MFLDRLIPVILDGTNGFEEEKKSISKSVKIISI